MWKLGRIAFRREEPGNQDWENKSKIGTDVETSMYEALQVGVCRDPKSGGARIRHQGSSEKLYKQLVTRGHGTNMATDSQCWNQKEHATSVFFSLLFYCLCYHSCPHFFLLCPPPPSPNPTSGHHHTIVHAHGSWCNRDTANICCMLTLPDPVLSVPFI